VSCGLHDVIALEARGVPAVLVSTDVFGPEIEEQTRVLGQPDQRTIEVPHPIQPTAEATIAGYADAVLDTALERLTASR
jgi:hypothetical protein